MNASIVRQPLLAAFATLLLVVAAAAMQWPLDPAPLHQAAPASDATVPELTEENWGALVVEPWLVGLQQNAPTLIRTAAALLLFLVGAAVGSTSARYALYPMRTHLAIPLYGLVGCGILLGDHYAAASVTAAGLVLSLRNLYASFRNGYSFDALLRGGIYLGCLPLIHARTLPLPVLRPLAAVPLKRSARECAVALFGLVLPILAYSYIYWGCGGEFTAPVREMWLRLAESIVPLDCKALSTLQLATGAGYLLLTLAAIRLYIRDIHATGTKQRAILLFNCCCFVLVALLIAFSSRETAFWMPVCAIPTATLLPVLFTRISPWIANPIYLLAIIACVGLMIA